MSIYRKGDVRAIHTATAQKRKQKRFIVWIVLLISLLGHSGEAYAWTGVLPLEIAILKNEEIHTDTSILLNIGSKAAILMEASSGAVILEKNADERRSPASITKIMTLILIFDAIQEGKLSLDEMVTTSAHAKSMGGSQVFLEEGEQQTVETLIKCIVIASGNDAAVAMAEHIGGSEEAFVSMMNQRAEGLGMTGTHFVDCCGLTDSPEHLTTARDVALMSRELITRYPQISDYSTIWMDKITHHTVRGSSEFGLSNTNKLLKQQTDFDVTGLKTGSTSIAGCCLSATGRKDGIDLIAVVLAAPDYKVRFTEAKNMLSYGFTMCRRYEDADPPMMEPMTVRGGKEETVALQYQDRFSMVRTDGRDFENIEKRWNLPEALEAPVESQTQVGTLQYYQGEELLGEIPIITAGAVEQAAYLDYVKKLWGRFWMVDRAADSLSTLTEG